MDMEEEPIVEFPSDEFDYFVHWCGDLPEDPRLMTIVASSLLDDLLTELLKATMIYVGGGNDSLFDSDRPLGSFSSRILLAYRLGLIDRDFESFLQITRRLRNDAAHAAQPIVLESAPHIDRIIKLKDLASKSPFWQSAVEDPPINAKETPAIALRVSLLIAILCLKCAVLSAQPPKIDTVCRFGIIRAMPDDETAASGNE